jgi:hypothetical protein
VSGKAALISVTGPVSLESASVAILAIITPCRKRFYQHSTSPIPHLRANQESQKQLFDLCLLQIIIQFPCYFERNLPIGNTQVCLDALGRGCGLLDQYEHDVQVLEIVAPYAENDPLEECQVLEVVADRGLDPGL